jgi:hypothetical protein
MNKPKVGERFKTNQGCECVVIEYNGAFDVVVQFQDDHAYIKTVSTGDLRRGEVANPFFRSVFGVGYYGIDKNSLEGYKSGGREYMFWKGAMERCYSILSSLRSPTYVGCAVDEVWHNFQNFGGWCQDQVGFNEKGWQLDKDLLGGVTAGKVYSPDVCIFVPQEINTLFIIPTTKTDDLPTGVSYVKDRGNYQAGCGAGGYRKALGRFPTPELAYEAYMDYKKIRVSELVGLYAGRVDDRLITKLKEFLI